MDAITVITYLGSIGGILVALKPWAELSLKVEEEYRKEMKVAAQKLLEALDQTELYIGSGSKSGEPEGKLVQSWHAAAIELSNISPSLSELCYLKGEHWKSPDKLSREEIEQAGFTICQLKESIRKLLGSI